jgi:hypothetical protein
MGLSINIARNLLVACYSGRKILEYTTSGSLVREICFKSKDIELQPFHAIQVTSNHFAVSCWNVSYINQLQSTTQPKFHYPCHLSVDRNNELIFVAEKRNNRVVILNRSRKCCARELNVATDDGLQGPSCVYFNTLLNQLFVGESTSFFSSKRRDTYRVLMFCNVI